jgi:hypothetical protein
MSYCAASRQRGLWGRAGAGRDHRADPGGAGRAPPGPPAGLLHRERQRDADERERRRQSRHQWFNSVGILFGIIDVLAAFVREHDPAASVPDAKLPAEPDTDVLAALTVLGRIPHSHHFTDLHATRIPGSQIPTATKF